MAFNYYYYRKLNKQTDFNNYSMLHIEDLLHGVKWHKIMPTLDLTPGYHQIPIREQDIPKTALVVPSGCYVFRRMSFGSSSDLCTFQKLMDQVLQPVLNKCALFDVHDIIIISNSAEEYLDNLN